MKVKIMLLAVLAFVSFTLGIGLTLSCSSYERVVIEGEPQECNDFYSLVAFYNEACKKPVFGDSKCSPDSAFIGTLYAECKDARERKRKIDKENSCKKEWFGDQIVSKKETDKYINYLECIK